MDFQTGDLRIETHRPATPNALITMRITHMPTGLTVEGQDKSYYQLYTTLMLQIRIKVALAKPRQIEGA